MDMTFAEKILAKYANQKEVEPSQIVTVKPDHLLTHDNAAPIIQKIQPELETYGIYNKKLPIIVLDHVIPAVSEKTATNHKIIREFVKKYGIEHFFDVPNAVNLWYIKAEDLVNFSDAVTIPNAKQLLKSIKMAMFYHRNHLLSHPVSNVTNASRANL